MKPLFPIPVTELLPEENLPVFTNKGERYYIPEKNGFCWMDNEMSGDWELDEDVTYWYSESMPPELANAVERLPLAVQYLGNHEYHKTAEAMQTILKYL